MASQPSQQYAFRAQKSMGLVGGTPDYAPVSGFISPDVPARTYHYSADGRLYAYALPSVVRIFQAEGAQLLQELPLPNVVELHFSPRGTYISTWERPVKLEDGGQHKNLRVFSASTGEELISFTQKSQDSWDLQYTISESHAVRLVGPEIQVYSPAEWAKGIVDRLKVEGASSVSLSPGLNPSIAVFVAEKKGAPASIKIFGLQFLNRPATCQKMFYKADRAQIKWNTLGTQVLLLTQTEVDNSNKSYYGETGMYLLSAAGNFDCRVTLDKEGPIHDFAWSPNSKEFGVVYGYMPAKTMLFDQRVRTLHDFGSSPHNFISFNPQGRLLALAGFGNLAGKIDIFDRRTLNKVTTIDAPNTSHCEWSPDGRFLLTATLSPRLRVDNGIKIWHCSGPLMHLQPVEELYQVSWRPASVESATPFGTNIPAAPEPNESVRLHGGAGANGAGGAGGSGGGVAKPAGAYRPPGARGLATPAIFKREDEGGIAMNGTSTPSRGYSRSPAPVPGSYRGDRDRDREGPREGNNGGNARDGGGRRHVPGAPPPSGAQGQGQGQGQGPDGEKKGRKRKGKKDNEDAGAGGAGGGREQRERGDREPRRSGEINGTDRNGHDRKGKRAVNGESERQGGSGSRRQQQQQNDGEIEVLPVEGTTPIIITPLAAAPSVDSEAVPPTPLDGSLDPTAKKIRNLNKKLKAIDELKEKAKRGERLEATQLKKMEGEAEIRKELVALEATL